ncbi:uncharacterized protein Triagg1_1904 [Trichoderma aggressivum f. europaeum]|uniref:DUF7907 domain-containing protein n=1 Tax=Trichoderma aggressivum f. europaeum TaxID=173218 RepID=A0AAE1ILT9_9HYPO|nr:hypothetical protein Triagg1_1904 [Trichoderma aggressivum f. europaeum]
MGKTRTRTNWIQSRADDNRRSWRLANAYIVSQLPPFKFEFSSPSNNKPDNLHHKANSPAQRKHQPTQPTQQTTTTTTIFKMLASTAALLGLVGAAAASPLNVVPNYPAVKQSTGFRLYVNVTDKALDFSPSIQGLYVTGIHVGAGLNEAGLGSKSENPSIFYQNGTASDVRFSGATTITDQGSPLVPYGISLSLDAGSETLSSVNINGGAGTNAVQISQFPEGFRYLGPETFVVCNEPLAYYQGTKFNVLKQAATTISSSGQIEKNIPAGCVPVRLLPECATLEVLPAGSYASHEYAINSDCYADVASINWSLYGP